MNFLEDFPVEQWTYGSEMQFGDWDALGVIPPGFRLDEKEIGNMNSNGIASDPSRISYHYGGEILTPPSSTPEGQGANLELFLGCHPEAALNHRSSLHVHIAVPGLGEHLPALKQINRYNGVWLPKILNKIEPMPRPERNGESPEAFKEKLRRWRKRVASHHSVTTPHRIKAMSEAVTLSEFFEGSVSRNRKGVPNWHYLCRPAVNIIRLYKIGRGDHPTIEFRHFPGTLDSVVLIEAVAWCRDYLIFALLDKDPTDLLESYLDRGLLPMPTPEFVYWRELNFQRTTHHSKYELTRTQIEVNIAEILGTSS